MVEQDRKIEESRNDVAELKRSCQKFNDEIHEMQREWKGAEKSVFTAEKRLQEMETKCQEVSISQARLDENVEGKYNRLWNDVVVNGLEEVKMSSIKELKREIQKKNEDSSNRSASLVNYALQVMSKAAEVAKRTQVKKEFVDLWREKANDRARMKLACRMLDTFWVRRWRGRDCFRQWKDRASEETKIIRLAREYEAKIPDVPRIMGILEDTGIPEQVQDLWVRVRELGDQKANQRNVLELLKKASDDVDVRFERVTKVETEMGSQGKQVLALEDARTGLEAGLSRVEQQVSFDAKEIKRIDSGLGEFAKGTEVSGMMKDVLLIWNSIKQLDAAKADKTEMDAMALEGLNKEKLAARRLEDIEADSSSKLSEGVMMMHERWQDLHGKVDENSKQLQTLQQMLGPLASFVEELVAKIAETQGVDTMRLPPGAMGGGGNGNYRPPPRESSNNGAAGGSRSAGGPSAVGPSGSGAAMAAVDSMEQWLSGAKGIVEASLDPGGQQGGAPRGGGGARYSAQKPPPRPGSARAHRPPAAGGGDGPPPTMVTGQRLGVGGLDNTLPSTHSAGHWAVGQRRARGLAE